MLRGRGKTQCMPSASLSTGAGAGFVVLGPFALAIKGRAALTRYGPFWSLPDQAWRVRFGGFLLSFLNISEQGA